MESLIECPSEVSSLSRPQVSSKGVAPGGAQWVRGREESREESTLRRWMCAEEPQAPGQFWAGSWQALKPVRQQPHPHWRSWGGNVQQQEEDGEGWAVQLVSSFCGSNSSLKERWGCEWLGRSGRGWLQHKPLPPPPRLGSEAVAQLGPRVVQQVSGLLWSFPGTSHVFLCGCSSSLTALA